MNMPVALAQKPASLVERTAQRYGVDPDKMLSTLKATAFRSGDKPISNEQMMALLIVAERHGLDPFTKQIYAYPDKYGGIVPVVGVDGWIDIVQSHPQFDGMSFVWQGGTEANMTCTIWRKDRTHPTVVTEYLDECRRNTEPWKMARRMMRHKALIQCARVAFGFAGIHDEEEAADILHSRPQASTGNRVRDALKPQATAAARADDDGVIDMEEGPFGDEAVTKLGAYLESMAGAGADEAIELLDRARTDLTDPGEYETLAGAYRARFTPEIASDDN